MSLRDAVAIAHPNLALSKYWGKRDGAGNFPAVPSLSVTLAGLTTRTRVRWRNDLPGDRVVLDGRELGAEEAVRALALITRVRAERGISAFADVESRNDFPTASGLASSASGFAALAVAAVQAADCDWDAARISDLARRASASAARSIFGGFVELDAGPLRAREEDVLSAHQVAPSAQLPLVVLVCVTTEAPKAVSSTDGMRKTMAQSPYASAWLEHAPRLHRHLRDALLARDFDRVGELAEGSALAMHACALAAGVTYWNAGTLEALAAVRALREGGTPAFATIDAGPHVKVLVRPEDAARAREAMTATPGVRRIIEATAGEGARLAPAGEGP
jgi:diphosphomevalonate decarboxylase